MTSATSGAADPPRPRTAVQRRPVTVARAVRRAARLQPAATRAQSALAPAVLAAARQPSVVARARPAASAERAPAEAGAVRALLRAPSAEAARQVRAALRLRVAE